MNKIFHQPEKALNETFGARISLLIVFCGSIFWLGGLNVRDIISNDILIMGTLDFIPNINPMIERAVFGLIAKSSILILISYTIVWISGIVYLSKTKLKFKQNGWLLMSAILFYLFTPVEIYTFVLDSKMIYMDLLGQGDLVEFRKLLIHRLAALAGASRIAQLCYYTIIFLVVFQPLKHRTELI